MKIITEQAQPVHQLRKNVPPNVDAALARALEKLPADRFESAKAFADALANPSFMSSTAGPAADAERSVRSVRAWMRSPWSWAALAVIALLGAASVWLKGRSAGAPDVTFIPRTFRPEAIFVARFGPDGQTIVFSATGETGTVSRLFVVRPDYPEAAQFGPDSTHLLAVSSKGELAVLTGAAYLGHRLFEGTLATLPLGGGAPREVLTKVREADWSPDGTAMAVIRTVDGVDRLEYPVGNVVVRSAGYFSDVRVSADNQRIAFLEHPGKWDDRGSAVIIDRKGSELARSPVYWSVEGLAWGGQGSTVLFSGAAATSASYSALTVYSMNAHGKTELALASAGGLTLQDVARNGRWLVTKDDQPYRLFAGTAGERNERELGWLDVSVSSLLSPDGSQIAFSDQGSTGGINYAVLRRKMDGSPAARLGEGQPVSFSRDGKSILAVVPTVPPRIMLYPTGAGEPSRLDSGQFNAIAYHSGLFTHDGHIFTCGSVAKQRLRCWVGQVAGGAFKAVTPEQTTHAVITPDGEKVIAQFADSFHLYATNGKWNQAAQGLTSSDVLIRWSPDGREVWAWNDHAGTIRVDRIEPLAGKRTALLTITPHDLAGTRNFQDVSLADDGRRYAYIQVRYMSTLFTVERPLR